MENSGSLNHSIGDYTANISLDFYTKQQLKFYEKKYWNLGDYCGILMLEFPLQRN